MIPTGTCEHTYQQGQSILPSDSVVLALKEWLQASQAVIASMNLGGSSAQRSGRRIHWAAKDDFWGLIITQRCVDVATSRTKLRTWDQLKHRASISRPATGSAAKSNASALRWSQPCHDRTKQSMVRVHVEHPGRNQLVFMTRPGQRHDVDSSGR